MIGRSRWKDIGRDQACARKKATGGEVCLAEASSTCGGGQNGQLEFLTGFSSLRFLLSKSSTMLPIEAISLLNLNAHLVNGVVILSSSGTEIKSWQIELTHLRV
jgi:hypothetical protein